MSRRWVFAVLALLVAACGTPRGDAPDDAGRMRSPVAGYPSSMIALGDSLTAAYGSCLAPTACPRNSWATGDGTQVDSHYQRILERNPAIRNRARNVARPGARVDELRAQAAEAVAHRAEYVTVLIGGNDACRGEMTGVAGFRAHLDAALTTIKAGLPKARLLIVSIPDIYRVWEVGRASKVAVGAWRSGICPNLLQDATSSSTEATARRTAFRDRIAAYNRQIAAACTAYGARCRHDDVARFSFTRDMLSAIDFFHPNAAGQEALADQTYPGSFTW